MATIKPSDRKPHNPRAHNTGAQNQRAIDLVQSLFSAMPPSHNAFVAQFEAGSETEQSLIDHFSKAIAHRPSGESVVEFVPFGVSTERLVALCVATDDMPFLFESIRAALIKAGLTIDLALHPVQLVQRDSDGNLVDFDKSQSAKTKENFKTESLQLHLARGVTSPAQIDQLREELLLTLRDIRNAVNDWSVMQQRLRDLSNEYSETALPIANAEAESKEIIAFFNWLLSNNFTFLGMRSYSYHPNSKAVGGVDIELTEGLGVLRDNRVSVLGTRHISGVVQFLLQPIPLLFSRSSTESRVRRRTPMDVIVIKHFNQQGLVVGELRLTGLFSSAALKASTLSIPLLRQKVARVQQASGLNPSSYNGKVLLQCLEDYPRDELFAHSEAEILDSCLGVVALHGQRRVALFTRLDNFGRFVSTMIYVPQERFSQTLREKCEAIVTSHYGSLTVSSVIFTDGLLARLYCVMRLNPAMVETIQAAKNPLEVLDHATVESRLAQAARSWSDFLHEKVAMVFGSDRVPDFMAAVRDRRDAILSQLPPLAKTNTGATAPAKPAIETGLIAGMEPESAVYDCLMRLTQSQGIPAAYREEVSPQQAVHDLLLVTAMQQVIANETADSTAAINAPLISFSLKSPAKNSVKTPLVTPVKTPLATLENNPIQTPLETADKILLESLARNSSLEELAGLEGLAGESFNLRFCQFGESLSLSQVLPILSSLGLSATNEQSYEWTLSNDKSLSELVPNNESAASKNAYWLHEIWFNAPWTIGELIVATQTRKFRAAFDAIWRGDCECDSFNRLIAAAQLEWREVALWRSLCHYLHQIGFPIGFKTMAAALVQNPTVTQQLTEFFMTKFNPDLAVDLAERKSLCQAIVDRIEESLDGVASLEQDSILRRLMAVTSAIIRTNYFQHNSDGSNKSLYSFKLVSAQIPELPQPRPLYEVWVYSARMEGIHLRGGKVARGGIRWSERRDDFRTEVLGLVKAQRVKNAVIVPTGSKGGFVVKNMPNQAVPPATLKQAQAAEIIACYQCLIRGLLEITDNFAAIKGSGNSLVKPLRTVLWDDDDPYLVVAADKGTASFSDIANRLSQDFGFWLDDAFASGGSVGYDHKKMGITARGAYISAERHARHQGFDPNRDSFTAVGIGDMSGDVFGNGMLRTRTMRLLAAFDHRHIFLDPNPDAEKSFNERARLFALPSSSWADYDAQLISQGGGVYPRSLKAIPISKEVQKILAIEAEELSPNELMKAILRAQVQLLWFGGIGTYIKATSESNSEVGDRANDPLRINGSEIRAKMVVEGANLGVTQLGRIEYGLQGGNINTDAIDNSAGVDCSDHEVNIKIIFAQEIAAGLLDRASRDKLLAAMTDEVGQLVLRDNYLQNFALSVMQHRGINYMAEAQRLMRSLEATGELNRAIEQLPLDATLAQRQTKGMGLTRSEYAVLLAYAKISLNGEIMNSSVPDEPSLHRDFITYFPKPLQEKLGDRLFDHRLRREIIGTILTNMVINFGGAAFVSEILHRQYHSAKANNDSLAVSGAETTAEIAAEIAKGFLIFRELFAIDKLWHAIEALDQMPLSKEQPATVAIHSMQRLSDLMANALIWWLDRPKRHAPVTEQVTELAPLLEMLKKGFSEKLAKTHDGYSVENELAMLEAVVDHLSVLDILASVLSSNSK